MNLRIVTVGALKEFVEEDAFFDLPDAPITSMRAISQSLNPNAELADPALVIAYGSDKEVLAYFGCLPDSLREDAQDKICWSSCWWVHPQKGKAVAMPVFYKALQLWDGKMLFDGLPQRSQAVLKQMGYFSFLNIEGCHAFLRFKLHKIIPSKFPRLSLGKNIFYLLDKLLNIPVRIRLAYWKKRKELPHDVRINQIDHIDKQTEAFIENLAAKDLIKRTGDTFNWIIDYPWLSSDKKYKKKYYFSAHAKRFEHILLQVYQNDKMIAFLWLSYRDETIKLPYCYVKKGKEEIAVRVLHHHLIQFSADTFICYQQNILDALVQSNPPFIFHKAINKVFAWSTSLDSYFKAAPYIQDGDGDSVFT